MRPGANRQAAAAARLGAASTATRCTRRDDRAGRNRPGRRWRRSGRERTAALTCRVGACVSARERGEIRRSWHRSGTRDVTSAGRARWRRVSQGHWHAGGDQGWTGASADSLGAGLQRRRADMPPGAARCGSAAWKPCRGRHLRAGGSCQSLLFHAGRATAAPPSGSGLPRDLRVASPVAFAPVGASAISGARSGGCGCPGGGCESPSG
jgi:hypothetical protein